MTEGISKPLDQAENIFKLGVWDTLVTAGEVFLFSKLPFLSIWPLKGAVSYLLKIFSENIYSSFKILIDVNAIALLNLEHKKAFDQESVKLKIIAQDYGIDSEQFKIERENAKKVLAQFVSYNRN